MDKLIELLNEYDKIKGDKEEPIYNWKIAIKTKIYQTYLVSAHYGFIKRLVENDKIDFSREGNLSNELVNLFERKLDTVEGVIALLSIQDKSIDFLISILK